MEFVPLPKPLMAHISSFWIPPPRSPTHALHHTHLRRPGRADHAVRLARCDPAPFAVVSRPGRADGGRRHRRAGLPGDLVRRHRADARLAVDNLRHIAGGRAGRRAPRAAFLAAADLRRPVADRRLPVPGEPRRGAAGADAAADRLLHRRRHGAHRLRAHHPPVSQLGLDPRLRRRRPSPRRRPVRADAGHRRLAARPPRRPPAPVGRRRAGLDGLAGPPGARQRAKRSLRAGQRTRPPASEAKLKGGTEDSPASDE